jgi:glycosyltransferase involved in cell wall biosynthesis
MLGFSDSDFVVGNIGTLSSRKGQASLLRGIGNVVGRYPSLKVVVVGSQREHEKDIARELFESASLGDMAGRVLFLEARNDVDALLNAFDIFAMPSRQEGFGIALVEAMATGLPCLVSDIPSFRELTKGSESVLFHPVDDHEAVASQLDRMISSPLLREGLSRNAMETARGRFSKEVMLAKWEKIYRQVLRENSQPGPAREDQTRQDRAI